MARVSTTQYINSFINQIYDSRTRIEKTRSQISSGFKVENPSDDPGRSGTIVNLQSLLQRIDGHQKRITYSKAFLETQESAVSSANEVLIRAQELATQGANGTVASDVRAQIADEIFQLRDQLASIANTQFQGIYVYGGLSEGDPPFDLNETFYPTPATGVKPEANRHYALDLATADPGQDTTRTISISDTESVRINSTARSVFLDAINSLDRLGRALTGVRTDLIDADGDGVIDDPDPAGTHLPFNLPDEYALQTQEILNALNSIASARMNNIETELSSIGARSNRLDQTKQILDTLKLNTDVARASIQDADIYEASSQFTILQTSLEALLASGSRISSLSLLNYL